jgi:hypothetical protein
MCNNFDIRSVLQFMLWNGCMSVECDYGVWSGYCKICMHCTMQNAHGNIFFFYIIDVFTSIYKKKQYATFTLYDIHTNTFIYIIHT